MTNLSIIIAPDQRLKQMSRAVGNVGETVQKLMVDMLATMHDADGIGLAAPQIGVLQRVIVIDIAKPDAPPAPLQMADPEILWASDERALREEGCLSIPQLYADVERPARVAVRFKDFENQTREIEMDDLLATCVQHEIDHLDGILFIDRISLLKRNMILRKLAKARKAASGV